MVEKAEGTPLLTSESPQPSASNQLALKAFLTFSILLSLNHGTVTAVLALASSLFDEASAGVGNGLLYFFTGTTALLFAAPLLDRFGTKNSVVAGMAFYCVYVAAYFGGSFSEYVSTQTACAAIGGIFGGVAAGLTWVAQGSYLSVSASAHAESTSCVREDSTAKLSGLFATIYLVCEFGLKLLSWFLLHFVDRVDDDADGQTSGYGPASTGMLAVFTAIAVVSAAASPYLITVPWSESNGNDSSRSGDSASYGSSKSAEGDDRVGAGSDGKIGTDWWQKVGSAYALCAEDPRILLLAPFNISFAFMSAVR